MKFKSHADKLFMLAEIDRFDLVETKQGNLEWEPEQELIDALIQKRTGLIKSVKDFSKSQAAKASWRKNRYKIMKGIRKFHKSTQGKQFHRRLGNFLATRMIGIIKQSTQEKPKEENFSSSFITESLKSISSLRTHLYIESEYYMSFSEFSEFLDIFDEVVETSSKVEHKLIRHDFEIDEEDLDLLGRMVDPSVFCDELSKLIGEEYLSVKNKFEQYEAMESYSYSEIVGRLCADFANR